jgi:hypothetical protein
VTDIDLRLDAPSAYVTLPAVTGCGVIALDEP